jgi:O-antigen/teichoic acid export membrane protein
VLPDGTRWTPEADLSRFTKPSQAGRQLSDAPTASTYLPEPLLEPPARVTLPKNGDQPISMNVVAPAAEGAKPAPAVKKPSVEKATRRQIRGSSLLLIGRLISIAVTTFVQIATVRYLSKGDYGAFAYALSIEALGETIVTLGLDRAVTRFVPIYQERDEYDKLFGTLIMVVGTIFALGTLLILGTLGLQGFIAGHLINDQLAVNLLVILIALSPIDAFDNILNSMFAVFSSPSAIFFRKYVLGPALKIGVVMLLIMGHSNVTFLAFGYVGSGLLGIAVFAVFLIRMMRQQDLFSRFDRETMRIPMREVLSFTMPLLASDLVYVVMNSMDAVLLGHSRGSVDVAAFRAVQPTARLNQVVLASFALLFTPAAARLFAHDDKEGINRLYWQNAAWVAIVSFPIFALTFSLAKPVTIMLYGTRYEQSALIMAMLSFGYYFNAATGQNGLTLKVLGKLRYIVSVDIMAAVVNLGINLLLIPRYGALGAATGTMSTMIVFNILKQAGLVLDTGIKIFDWDYLRVYAIIILGAVGLLLVQVFLSPPTYAGFAVAALVSVLVLKVNGRELDLASTFPELLRIPAVRWLFSE